MEAPSLFPELNDGHGTIAQQNARAVALVRGLCYVPDFLTRHEEAELIQHIDDQPWLDDLQRRVQHYGYKYDYRSRKIDAAMAVGPLPDRLARLGQRLAEAGHLDHTPDQLIVNEYHPGQGITAHVDCEPCFGDRIVSVTLGSGCSMDFTRRGEKGAVAVYLQPRSAVVLTGEARYDWMHSIAKRQKDTVAGVTIPRSRRVSLTFRTVLL